MSQDPESSRPPAADGLSRRTFIGGLAATALLPAFRRAGASPNRTQTPAEIEAWKKTLFQAGQPLVYRAQSQPQAAFPTGGIGCGNVYVGVGGHLRDWLIFNNTGPVQVPNTFFAVRTTVAGREPVTRMLQTEMKGLHVIGQFGATFQNSSERVAAPGPGVQDVELVGEYPTAHLRYLDPALPVEIRLETFTPWIPQNAKSSATPGTVFLFRVRNPGRSEVRVSLLAALHNAVGLGAEGRARNFNEGWREDGVTGIRLAAPRGAVARLARPLELVAAAPGFQLAGVEQPEELTLRVLPSATPVAKDFALSPGKASVIWLEDASTLDLPAVEALADAVEQGATLVISGTGRGLLEGWAAALGGAPDRRADLPFDDFESGTFGKWKVEGKAFGLSPQRGTQPGQQPMSGFGGKFLINSFTDGDTPTGRMTSIPFRINRRYIRFRIGGGHWEGRTCINLVVDGRVVRTATGKDQERLEPHAWDVSDLQGKEAHFEIVDAESGAWGHVNVDDLVFSDLSGEPLPPAAAARLGSLLPLTFEATTWHPEKGELSLPARDQAPAQTLALTGYLELRRATQQADSERIAGEDGGPAVWERRVGKGRVVLLLAPLVPPGQRSDRRARQQALGFLAYAAGIQHTLGEGIHPHDRTFGELALATPAPGVTGLLSWSEPAALWEAFARQGALAPLPGAGRAEAGSERSTNAALAVETRIPSGKEVTIPVVLAWHFPNYYFNGHRVGNRYTRFWSGARETAAELASNWKPLREATERYRKAAYESTLPYYVTDCLTSQTSTIRSEVCVWLEDGTFAGFEGADGCCPMNCSHVWGYEQSLSRLFPELEKSMREADFKHQQRPDGGINNRIALPVEAGPTGEMPFADGHASGILKAYREHLNSADDTWLRDYWWRIKKAVEYLVRLDGEVPDGILEGPQWNTYDCVVYGPNSFIGTYYLAALRAGEEMARLMDEPETARRWRQIFESGRQRLVELCWNGEYFQQNLPDYERRTTQWGPGCLSDQLIGQWWAHQLRLGYLLPQDQVRSALRAIFKHNWRWDFADFRHRQRVYADQHDKGLLNCTWPKGGRPANPILYCDEVWTGVEYQVAGHMVYEGMLEEALTIVRGARERYDGQRRNPWNELECGGHYARAMANWSLLTGFSGYHHDGPQGLLCFDPVFQPNDFRSLFTVAEGWGSFSQQREGDRQRNELRLDHGRALLRELQLGTGSNPDRVTVRLGNRRVSPQMKREGRTARLIFEKPLEITAGQRLVVDLG